MQLFKTWCEGSGIKDPTLGNLPPIHKERIFVSYALEISQGQNIKNLLRISVNSVQNYLMAEASHATDNGQRDPVSNTLPPAYPSKDPNLSLCSKNSFLSVQVVRRKVQVPPAHNSYPHISRISLLVRGFPLLKQHVSPEPSSWAFKQDLNVANTAAAILHHNPTNSEKFRCLPVQAPLRSIPSPSSILTSPFCCNLTTLCLPPTPLPKLLISEFDFALTKEAPEISRNRPSANSQQTDHRFSPLRGTSRPGLLDVLRPLSPHSYLLLS